SSASPCSSTSAPSVLSNLTLTFLPSKPSVHLCISPCPRIRRSTTKVWSSSQLPLTASTPLVVEELLRNRPSRPIGPANRAASGRSSLCVPIVYSQDGLGPSVYSQDGLGSTRFNEN